MIVIIIIISSSSRSRSSSSSSSSTYVVIPVCSLRAPGAAPGPPDPAKPFVTAMPAKARK